MVDKVLSYGDVLLRVDDLALLKGPHWLNDTIIEFYFEYLANEVLRSGEQDSSLNDRILLVGPAVSFWLTQCESLEELNAIVGPLNFSKREIILFAVNDNVDVDVAEGGSHWSALLFTRESGRFTHFDSGGGSNRQPAVSLAKAAASIIGQAAKSSVPLMPSAPQQMNGYDCGMFVLAIALALCQSWRSRGPTSLGVDEDPKGVILREVTASRVTTLRAELLSLILELPGKKLPE